MGPTTGSGRSTSPTWRRTSSSRDGRADRLLVPVVRDLAGPAVSPPGGGPDHPYLGPGHGAGGGAGAPPGGAHPGAGRRPAAPGGGVRGGLPEQPPPDPDLHRLLPAAT